MVAATYPACLLVILFMQVLAINFKPNLIMLRQGRHRFDLSVTTIAFLVL